MNLGTLLIVVSALWVASEILLSIVKRSQATDRRADRSSLRVLWLTIAVAVNLGVLLGLQPIGRMGRGFASLAVLGLALILVGAAVRWVAILTLKRRFTVDVAISQDHALVREGIYGTIRHPAYLGSMISFFGLGLSFMNVLSLLVIVVPVTVAFLHRIRIEEQVLLEVFGEEFGRYCASTKRLLPGIY
jgi:protein-S-isoprenylcysteine O-methyltransferase Ste14